MNESDLRDLLLSHMKPPKSKSQCWYCDKIYIAEAWQWNPVWYCPDCDVTWGG